MCAEQQQHCLEDRALCPGQIILESITHLGADVLLCLLSVDSC